MRRVVLALVVLGLLAGPAAQAQVPSIPTIIMPSPLGIIITVGSWLLNGSDKAVYYIEVAGDGSNPEDARANGFRLAVEQALGSLIASETEVRNDRIYRDEIISYAAGYVDRFEIISTQRTERGSRVAMKVWVSRSALANRLLNQTAKSGEIDGARASVQIESLKQERATGDRLLTTVVNDFPRRAFNIRLKSAQVQFSQTRSTEVLIPYELQWSPQYLSSLWEAVIQTSQARTGNNQAFIAIQWKPTGNWFQNNGGYAMFDDAVKPNILWQRFVVSEPRLQLRILDAASQVVYQNCYVSTHLDHYYQYNIPSQSLVNMRGNGVAINGNFISQGTIKVNFDNNPRGLARAQTVELTVVLNQDCLKN